MKLVRSGDYRAAALLLGMAAVYSGIGLMFIFLPNGMPEGWQSWAAGIAQCVVAWMFVFFALILAWGAFCWDPEEQARQNREGKG